MIDINYKKCSACKKWLPLEYFGKNSHRCKICNRDNDWKRRYNLDPDTFFKMLTEQDEKCAICGEVFTKTPHVDHDHKTGKVRALLCGQCNRILGVYEDRHFNWCVEFENYIRKYKDDKNCTD